MNKQANKQISGLMSRLIAPDVGVIIEHGPASEDPPELYWVTGWVKSADTPAPDAPLIQDILFDIASDENEEVFPWCYREEATHISIDGRCTCIVLIADCKIIKRVDWPEEKIDEARVYANILAYGGDILV